MKVIFCHIPKCGGLSIRKHLELLFGKERCFADYTHVGRPDNPPVPPIPGHILAQLRRTDANTVVAGHFLLTRYRHIPAAQRVVFLRNPVERLCSHYYYWLKGPDPDHPHSQKLHQKGLSITKFAALPELRNVLSRFLDGTPVDELDFIGLVDRWADSVNLLYNFFGIGKDPQLISPHQNHNLTRSGARYPIDEETRQAVEKLNEMDMAIYDQAVSRFERLTGRYRDGY